MKHSYSLIIIIVYNPSLTFFVNNLQFDMDYVVIDNSEEQHNQFVKKIKEYDNVKYIQNNSNLGIATALNIGCQYAITNGYDYVITMDQDSVLTMDIINGLLKYQNSLQNNSNIAIISPLHIMQDGIQNRINSNSDVTYGINTMTSGNLVNLDIWQKLGGFDDKLFIDMVDLDYYCRCVEAGFEVITLNNIHMEHSLGEMKTIKLFNKRLKIFNHGKLRKYYQVRNSLYVLNQYKKTMPEVRKLLFRFLFHACVGVLFEKNRLQKFQMIYFGINDFYRNKYGKY